MASEIKSGSLRVNKRFLNLKERGNFEINILHCNRPRVRSDL